jgi:hypothetical protein
MTTLLEQIFQTLAEQIHNHYMVHLPVIGFLIANEVEKGYKSFAAQLVD